MAHSLIVDLLMRTGSFETDSKRAARQAQAMAKEIDRAGKIIGGALATAALATAAWVKSSINAADEAIKQAQSVGLLVEQYTALSYAGELSGVSQTELASALTILSRRTKDAADGSKEAADAFARLGVNIKAPTGALKDTDALLKELADRFARMPDGIEKTALATELLGRSGAKLIPLLNGGSQGLRDMAEEAAQLGVIIDTKTAKAAEQFNDNLTRLGQLARGFGNDLAAQFLPLLVEVTDLLVDVGKESRATGDDMKEAGTAFKVVNTVLQTFLVLLSDVKFVLTSTGREIGAWSAQIGVALEFLTTRPEELMQRAPEMWRRFRAISGAVSEDAERARKELDKFQARVMALGSGGAEAAGGSPAVTGGDPDADRRRAEEERRRAAEAAKLAEANRKRVEQYLDGLRKQLQATQDLSVAETVLADIRAGRLGTSVSRQQTQELLAVAQQIDAARKAAQAAADADAALREQNRRVQENFEASRRAASEQLTEANSLVQDSFEQTRALAISVETPMERLNRRLAELNTLAKENPFLSDNVELVGRLRKQVWDEWSESIGAVGKKLDDFGRTFAENAQNLLGDTLYQTWKGNTDGLLQLWGDMLLRMLAQAQAANLARALFGSDDSGNLSGGWLSRIGSAIAGYFGGGGFGTGAQYGNQDYGQYLSTGTNYVPYNGMRAVLHEGEAVVPKKYNPAAGAPVGGGGQRVEVNNYFGSEAQVSTRQGSDGRLIVDFERRVVGAVAADTARGGVTARAVAGRFGMGEGSTLTRRRG
jgi:hypothetical protein